MNNNSTLNLRADFKKKSVKLLGCLLLSLFFSAILYTIIHNQKIQVAREVESLKQQISDYELEIKTVEMRIEQEVNRSVLRSVSEELSVKLKSIPSERYVILKAGSPQTNQLANYIH